MSSPKTVLVVIFAGLTLLGQAFLLLFRSLFYERNFDEIGKSLPLAGPWALAMALIGVVLLAWRLRSLRAGAEPLVVLRVLGSLPRFFVASNALIFVGGTLAEAFLYTWTGINVLGGLDFAVIVSLGIATGGMGILQGIAMSDALLVRTREKLDLRQLPEGFRDLSLRNRLLWTTLGTVFLGGIMMGVATLGFYREVSSYYAQLSADALSGATVSGSEALASSELGVFLQMAGLVAFLLVWASFLILVVLDNLRRQIRRLSTKVHELSSGSADLTLRVPIVFFDELGRLTGEINAFLTKLQPLVAEVKVDANEVAVSAQRVSAEASEAAMNAVGISSSQGQVQQAVEGQVLAIHGTEDLLNLVAESTATVAGQVVEQVRLVSDSSAAIAQMAQNIASVDAMTQKADATGKGLMAITEKGSAAMNSMSASMTEIQTASRSVNEIVGLIAKIAAQTNLLAMNAAIEAAHAGDSGSGFAVVADEVRSLAETSARNARDIRSHIQDMERKIQAGGQMAAQAGQAFSEIAQRIGETSGLLQTISAAMGEQRLGGDQVLESTQGLVAATDQIRLLTEVQKGHTTKASDAMQQIIAATRAIEQAVTSQTLKTHKLTGSMGQVNAEAQTNAEVSSRLQEAVKGFTV